ncbi:MAG: alpha/beta hydrolase [Solirubrobacterales bacterium]|nr:alpha/beta hydrolase [Solirubrobacterales bacterium]
MPATQSTRTGREELGRIVSDTRAAVALATGRASLPDPTPADGPDPYGNPDPEWLGVDWGAYRREVDVVGARVNYVEMGEGPPVVFVHGLSGAWQNWLEQIPEFARDHRVIALDLPGFGSSPMPPWDISVQGYGSFLRDFCEKLGIDHAAIVGNSLGGFIATEVAIAEANRVDRLVLVSAAGITWARARREPAAMLARMARATTPLAFRFQLSGIRRPRIRQAAFQGVFHDPNTLRRELLWESFVPALEAPAFYDSMTSLVGYDIRHRLEEIEDPTLIVWGRNDRVVPVPAALSYKRRIGDNAELHIFDQTGHVPQMERPVRFNRLLSGFLAS